VAGLHDATYKPTEVTLFMTSQCNLRCVYCYAQAGDLPATRMSLVTAKRGIDYIVANALERQVRAIGVHYHGGGEPTVNHAVLTASHAYARELAERHGLRLTSGIATNGVLAPRMRAWIIEHLTGASVSLDGAPEVNDLNRPTVSGAGSGAKVMETLQAFDAAGFHYGVRVTVSARTVDQMADTVRYILDHCAPARLQIEPVYDIGRGHATDLHVDSAAFIPGYRACWEIAHARGIELLYSSARIDTLSERFCRAYGEGFSLTPRGSVSGCYEVHDEAADFAGDVLFGSFDAAAGTYVFDDAKLARMRSHALRGQSWCDGCFARWHCSGDCPNKTRHAAVDGAFEGMPSCDITRNLVLDQLVRKIEGAGGSVWVERAPATSD
jgi:uncharacterized protein